jgi:hypothetical protein
MKKSSFFLLTLALCMTIALVPVHSLASNTTPSIIPVAAASEETYVDLSENEPPADFNEGFDDPYNEGEGVDFVNPELEPGIGIEGISAELEPTEIEGGIEPRVESDDTPWMPIIVVVIALIVAGAIATVIALRKPKPKV